MNQNKSFVYVMSSPSLPHIVKIGFSKNTENNAPFPFKIEKEWETEQPRLLEKNIHRQLSFCRIESNREFFGLSPKRAIELIEKIIKTGILEEKEKIDENLATKIENVTSLGQIIRQKRIKQNITQKQLALVCGTGLRFIGEIENGKSTAQVGKIFHILNMLRINVYLKF